MVVLFVGLVSALSLGGAARRVVDAIDERVFRFRVMMSNPGQLLRRQETEKREEEEEEKRDEKPREEIPKREDEVREEGTSKRRRRRERRRRHEAGAKERASGDAEARQETVEQEAMENAAKTERMETKTSLEKSEQTETKKNEKKPEQAETKKHEKKNEKDEARKSEKKSEQDETREKGKIKKSERDEVKKSEKGEARESREVKAEEESGVKSWALKVKRKDVGVEKGPGKRKRDEAMEYKRVVPVVDAIESEEEVVTLKPFLRAGRQLLKAFRSLGIPKNGNKWAVKGNKANFTISFDECWVSGVEVAYVVDDPCQFVKYYVDGVEGSLVGGNFTFAELTELHSLKLVTENVDTATSTCLWSCEVVCEDTEA